MFGLEAAALVIATLALLPVVWQFLIDYAWPWPYWLTARRTSVSPAGTTANVDVTIVNLSSRTAHFDVDFILADGDLFIPRNRVDLDRHQRIDETHHVLPHDRSTIHVSAADLGPEDRIVGVGVREPAHSWAGRKSLLGYRLYRI